MKPIIGILKNCSKNYQVHYARSIEKTGGIPIIIPFVDYLNTINPIINWLDGILFTGGTDINPKFYGESPKYNLGRIWPERDEYELKLADHIISNTDLPILGICRGMQLLNVIKGGTLYQNLAKEKPNSNDHWLDNFPKDYPAHFVKIEKPSILYSIFKKEELYVNSRHRQAINKLGSNFRVNMTANDGVIEGIESKDERFIVGLQWHPELMTPSRPEYLKLFKEFVKACKR